MNECGGTAGILDLVERGEQIHQVVSHQAQR